MANPADDDKGDSPKLSPLQSGIRSMRRCWCDAVQNAQENSELLCRSFQRSVYAPADEMFQEAKTTWRQVRRRQPELIVAGATALAMISSIPYGRLAFVRNSLLAAGVAFAVSSPEVLVDILKDRRPKRNVEDGSKKSDTSSGIPKT
uniref:MICOS complex subunit n=1 Tax=Spongospora subterranea TaxID=70186 RepID=A0A0H5R8B4_9EUKA|eukprot:CRZ10066.1 hypothetical protein [Spongospora subterranea]